MTYEHITNEEIIAKVAVKFFLTPYDMRMAAGERIQQQADQINHLKDEVARLSNRLLVANTGKPTKAQAAAEMARLRNIAAAAGRCP